jgi:hypothetical protein
MRDRASLCSPADTAAGAREVVEQLLADRDERIARGNERGRARMTDPSVQLVRRGPIVIVALEDGPLV